MCQQEKEDTLTLVNQLSEKKGHHKHQFGGKNSGLKSPAANPFEGKSIITEITPDGISDGLK